MKTRLVVLTFVLTLVLPSLAVAQDAALGTMPVSVQVVHGATEKAVADAPVFLQAARPRGPFEPTAPEPQAEWTGFTNADGTAGFNIPKSLTTSGLRIHAISTYGGVAFESAASTPGPGVELKIEVFEKGLDTSVVAFETLRTVVDLWEGYLVFTQFYTLTNEGKTALDVSALPGEEFEKGLPIELPVKAQGINVTGPGESMVVNSTVYWKGVLEPGARKNLQVRFSMSAKEEEFVYEQQMDYPTRNIEVVVPIQTRFTRVPRLDDLELRPPGFPETDRGHGIFGLRDDIEFVGARGASAEPGQSFRFQLRGLPFHKPKLPWFFLAFGFIMGIAVVLLGQREARRAATAQGKQVALEALAAEREEILDELVALEKDYDEGIVTAREYEIESLALRERLALVLKKIEDLEPSR